MYSTYISTTCEIVSTINIHRVITVEKNHAAIIIRGENVDAIESTASIKQIVPFITYDLTTFDLSKFTRRENMR